MGQIPYPGMEANHSLFIQLIDGYRLYKPKHATQEVARDSIIRGSHTVRFILDLRHYVELLEHRSENETGIRRFGVEFPQNDEKR